MLASNVVMLVKVTIADGQEKTLGYARLRLGRVGEGEFNVDGEVMSQFSSSEGDRGKEHIAVILSPSNFSYA